MKINSPQQIAVGREIYRSYGNSWLAALAAGKPDENGVLVVPPGPYAPEHAATPTPSVVSGSD